ncbi:branched-chain amino acid ABC transporter substrate-binding protein [Micropruina sp.]|uniref:branched-chain amino acid ABC transporter substrate-binding protein n=1 Tax=Micropruina sp. TaxID=2737536 RepID=UPI0039E22DE8
MRNKKLLGGAAALLSASLLFAGCGSRSEPAASGSAAATKVAKIGVIAPLSGDLSALGLGIKNSVDLAIRQANQSNAIPGWTLELAAEDDQASADVGKNAATKLSSDNEVVGVVGALNSSVSKQVIPVLQPARIVQVSPANTGPTLTMGDDFATSPKRVYDNFFRTCTTDLVQGKVAAQYLLDSGIKKLATIHDKKIYGQGLVGAVTENFKAGGGTIVAAETINPDDKEFTAVITKVKGTAPEAVFYGGEYPQAGPLSKQMKAAGLDVPLMGGDGIFDPTYIELAGSASNGDLATSVGEPADTAKSAQEFIAAYNAAGFAEPYAAYGAQSYDAAKAIIEALKVSLPSASDPKSAREATIKAMANVTFTGATGTVAFDEFGDTKSKVITVYKVESGKWATVKTFDVSNG